MRLSLMNIFNMVNYCWVVVFLIISLTDFGNDKPSLRLQSLL